ncbi:MAG: protein kinase [Planctomycetaceae bacterium]|nr:protein kinase [Planctomycetaceae bacterium]
MRNPKSDDGPQLVHLDPFLVDRARISLGLAAKELATQALRKKKHGDVQSVDYRTIQRIYRHEGLFPETARLIADVLGQNVLDLLAPWDTRYRPAALPGPLMGEAEWESEGYVDQGRLAPNGLYYIVCRMRHRHTQGKLARGKYYHLSWLSEAARDSLRHKLSRHADVCARIGVHPRIAVNFTSAPAPARDGWWVIDHWHGERTLADHLGDGPCPRETLPRLLLQIAEGLDALHRANIVFRELAPARVLISDKDGNAVLTDFELAKLLDGSPSVSAEWAKEHPERIFRAPEVDGGEATTKSDLYSFARVALAALGETTEDFAGAAQCLSGAELPKKLGRLLRDNLEPVPDQRPGDLGSLLKELSRWATKDSYGTV